MKKFAPGTRFKFDARPLELAGSPERVLILDGHPIEKYGCVFDMNGIDLSEFERTGRQGFWQHETDEPPICDWQTSVEGGVWYGKPTFHADNPEAVVIEKLWNAGKINAVSAGIEVVETIDNEDSDVTTISKFRPYEVSIVNFGAHPHAGKGLSLTLSAAVAEGVITEQESHIITQGNATRTELETLREENARLVAELAARPKPQTVRVVASQQSNPGGIAVNPEHLSAAVSASVSANIAAAAERLMRKMTGKLPD